MTNTVEFIWVRHGETQWNIDRRCQGQLNPPLSERGMQQARLVAARLVNEGPFDILICSDLSRATQTATCISEAIGMPIAAYYDELRERHMGRLHGLLPTEAVSCYGPDFRKQDLGQETKEHMLERAVKATERILHEHSGHKRYLITSHAGLINAFLTVNGIPTPEPLRNTSITRCVLNEDGTWSLIGYNDYSHLDEATLGITA